MRDRFARFAVERRVSLGDDVFLLPRPESFQGHCVILRDRTKLCPLCAQTIWMQV
jgi:hypothetical protein